MRAIIRFSPTLFIALQQLCKWASLEDTNVSVWLERDDDHVRICSKVAGTARVPHLEHSQWLQNVYVDAYRKAICRPPLGSGDDGLRSPL